MTSLDAPPSSGTLRGSLTQDEILEAGLRLAVRPGAGQLNMRELARSLGVTPMAIYHHFADKTALVHAILDRYLAKRNVTGHGIDPACWRPWLKQTFLNLYAAWRDGPAVSPFPESLKHFGPAILRIIDDSYGVLLGAGLTPPQTMQAHSALFSLTLGHATLAPFKMPSVAELMALIGCKVERRGRDHTVSLIRGPEALEALPNYRRMSEELALVAAGRETIEGDLDLLLDAVGRMIEPQRSV